MNKNLQTNGKVVIMSLIIWLAFYANVNAVNWVGARNYSTNTTINDDIVLTGNVTITVNTGVTVTITGDISSSSNYTFTKAGGGILYLTNDNRFKGTTIINAGQISLGNNTDKGSLSSEIEVAANGMLAFHRNTDHTYSRAISGQGLLVQAGTGIITLTGAHTIANTRIFNTLNIGSGSNSGSLSGDIDLYTPNAKLVFNRSGNFTYAGNITGDGIYGGVQKNGAGTLTLTGKISCIGNVQITAGQLTIGGAAGSITNGIQIDDNGTLNFNPSNNYWYDGVILGTGKILKSGTRFVYLTNDNPFTGTTTISAGVLCLGSYSDKGSLNGNIQVDTNGTLDFLRRNDYTFSNVISGTGIIIKTFNSNLMLTGNNTFTGTTTINTGTLYLGNNTSSGSVDGNIVVASGAELVFYHSNDYTFKHIISGEGAVNKIGMRNLTLTGNNSYSGLTSIGTGILSIGNGTTAGHVAGDIKIYMGGTLNFNNPGTYTYEGVISEYSSSSSGNVTKTGNGTLILTKNHTNTGTFTCSAGTLSLQGNWAGNFIKGAGSTLTVVGNRTIGGTLNMQGGTTNFNLSTISPLLRSRLMVTGALSKSGTNTLNISNVTNMFSSFTLISAASGVSTENFDLTGVAGTLSATDTELTFTRGEAATVPATPDDFTATAGDGQVTLSWTTPDDGGSPILNYEISCDKTSGYSENWEEITGSDESTTSLVVTGLTNGTEYTFQVRAVNDIGKGASTDQLMATPVSPATKTVTVGAQVLPIQDRTAGATIYNITTGHIVDGTTGTVTWYENASSMTEIAAPAGVIASLNSILNDEALLTIITTDDVEEGIYYFRVTFDGVTSDAATLAVDNSVGTNAIANVALKAYPNPFTDALRITGAEGCKLHVMNMAGMAVHTQLISSSDETLRLEQLPAGVYFLRFEKDGTFKTIKTIKE